MKNKILAGLLSLTLGASFALTSCDDVDDPIVSTTPIIKEVVTGGAEVTATSATVTGTVVGLSGQVADAYTVGVVYSTSENPTAGGTRVAGALGEDGTTVTATINGLSDGVTYYYATFVTLQGTISRYGEVKSFVTTDSDIATAAPAAVEATSANLGGTINGMQDKLEAGSLSYGIIVAPAAADINAGVKFLAEGTDNAYTVSVSNLVPNTAYKFAAFMNVNGADVIANEQMLNTPVGVDAKAESLDDYVDMGTRLEWCKYNVGAAKESEAGALLGFGDVTGFNYSTAASDYAQESITNTDRDAAKTSAMGMTPTAADWAELLAVSTLEAAEVDGVAGVRVTSTATGNSIFLPGAGMRTGATVEGNQAVYWTGDICVTNKAYAVAMTLENAAYSTSNAPTYTGALVRPVRKPYVNEIAADCSKLVIGDLESNGRVRIELYNEYGSNKADPAIDPSVINFEKEMVIDFTLTGVTGNLKEGNAGSWRAGLEYADADWSPSYWSNFDGNYHDCIVAGDGNYRVSMSTDALTEGAVVFCIDINGLGADIVDMSKVKVESLVIMQDPNQPMYKAVDASLGHFWWGNKEDNGSDERFEFYNEYGASNDGNGDPFAGIAFGQGTLVANVTITGIDGNLKAGAAGTYTGAMSYAGGGWNPQWWGGAASDVTFASDGTYNFPAYLSSNGTGAVVWVIDIPGLWKDLTDHSKLSFKVNSIMTTVHAE